MKIAPTTTTAPLHTPPAKAARDFLGTRQDLSDQPFGKLVSALARGQTIPPQGSFETP